MKCIILAGGSGERLWPISRDLFPKSMIKFTESKTLFQNALDIAKYIVPEKNIVAITNIRQSNDISLQMKSVCKKPVVLSEPMTKNTAPAVASSLTYLNLKKDDVVVILPVDFTVDDLDSFKSTIEKAKKLASKDYIVSIGVKPDYPETGYGYIKKGDDLKFGYKVDSFVEKPVDEQAKEYIENGYLWNCGIYVGKISKLIDSFYEYAPEIMNKMTPEMFDENDKIKYEYYEGFPSISIDYALIEKTQDLAVVELETKWHDFGSWQAIYNNKDKDSKANVVHGNVLLDKVKESFIYSSKELVAVSGMENIVVIETEDAVLVCNKDESSNINNLVKALKRNKSETTQVHKTVYRPWGFYTCLNGGDGWLTKIITVSPGHKLSLQSHNYRSEHWVVLEGTATVLLEDDVHTLNKRQSINIPLKAKHSLQNHTKEPLKILEVQKGEYISEDDIIRYEDMYGRVK